jgi:transcriptional regulator with XRE-family HTH domain
MPSRTRSDYEAVRLAADQLRTLGRELRVARILAGRTQADIAKQIDVSAAQVCRIERGNVPKVGLQQLVRFGGAVGLRVWIRAYPGGRRLMDEPQIALLGRFRSRCGTWQFRTEVTMPIEGDMRAADAVLSNGTCVIVVEAITRLADFQAQSRAALAKKRDLKASRLVLLIADTRANRRALLVAADVAAATFPLGTREVLRALEAGADPGADGIVML